MKLTHLLLPLGLTATLLAGCAGSVEPQYPPKELQDFTPKVSLDERWDQGIGEGLGRAAEVVQAQRLLAQLQQLPRPNGVEPDT